MELLEVQLVNARLKPLVMRPDNRDKHIVNVSAVEGQFYRNFKTTRHPQVLDRISGWPVRVVRVGIAARQSIHALRHQIRQRMGGPARVARIDQAAGQPRRQPQVAIDTYASRHGGCVRSYLRQAVS